MGTWIAIILIIAVVVLFYNAQKAKQRSRRRKQETLDRYRSRLDDNEDQGADPGADE